MSEENVEIAQRAYAALRDDDVDQFLTYLDPEVEWHSLILEIEGVFRGHDGVRRWWQELRSVFPDWDPSIVEIRDLGDWVLVHAGGTGSGMASGVGHFEDFWQIGRFRDGLMIWYGAFRGEDEALEAAGLSE
jgi:ketosteroid isomerase-like protein